MYVALESAIILPITLLYICTVASVIVTITMFRRK